jgi:hypothetical protein
MSNNMFQTIKNDLYKIDELSVGLEFYRWIPDLGAYKMVIKFKELIKCKIIEICKKLEDGTTKTNIKYSFDRNGVTETRETQVFGLLEYAYRGSTSIPNSLKNNSKDFIATGLAGSQFHFFKVSSYDPNAKLELFGGEKKIKNKK